ncbi:MAG: hypothetical protein DHS20C17_31350 [Cyclobacteriaceae bacterium]|nr:MAG: hypothetical protein DHS20C17_31350 [Cyclobacteriaceae bacterium]
MPTWIGWLFIFLFLLVTGYLFLHSVYDFLAINKPLKKNTLVIESWIPDIAIPSLIDKARDGDYRRIVVAGGRELKGSYLSDFETTADRLRATLILLGLDSTMIYVVRNQAVVKDRTYNSAVSVSTWIRQFNKSIDTLDVATIGPHARRSKMLFELALSQDIKVGVICIDDLEYNPNRWWQSSTGFKSVVGECISYFYAKFFFNPEDSNARY